MAKETTSTDQDKITTTSFYLELIEKNSINHETLTNIFRPSKQIHAQSEEYNQLMNRGKHV